MEWAGVQWSQVRDSDAQMETMPHRLNKARGTDRVEVKQSEWGRCSCARALDKSEHLGNLGLRGLEQNISHAAWLPHYTFAESVSFTRK